MFATTVATAVISIMYRFLSAWENKKRDQVGVESYEHAYDDDLTDTKVQRSPENSNGGWADTVAESTVPLRPLRRSDAAYWCLSAGIGMSLSLQNVMVA